MRKYYTRPCNFYYGNYAKKLVKSKKALFLAANPNIAFDTLEIFQRKKTGTARSELLHVNKVKTLKKEKALKTNNFKKKKYLWN